MKDIFIGVFDSPEAAAVFGQELLLPIKEIIDYKQFANRLLRTYAVNTWDPTAINGREVWRSVG